MENFPSFFSRARWFGTLFLALCAAAFTVEAAPKTTVEPPPPQPVAQKVTVKRGGSVDIPLRIYGTRAQTLSWLIRTPPQHGKLSAIRATAAEAAVVSYRPPADVRIASDRFTFSVRSNEGVSAPVEVTISIEDDPPQITSASELDFGTLLKGTSATKVFEFTNSGGGIAEGTFAVNPPWSLVGPANYRLKSGERQSARVTFAPDRVGKFEGEVRFSSQPDSAVLLRGAAEDALAVSPAELRLAQDPASPFRAAVFEIRNNSEAPTEVKITASPRLVVKPAVQLAARESVTLTVQSAEGDTEAIEEIVALSAGKLRAYLTVRAAKMPALIHARPGSVVFRQNAGPQSRERVVLTNRGGTEAKLTLSIEAPFSVSESAVALAPKVEKEVVIASGKESATGAQGLLKIAWATGSFDVPVEVVAPSATVAASGAPRPAKSTARNSGRGLATSEAVEAVTGIRAATMESVSANSATFYWITPTPEGRVLRCMQRTLTVDENGELAATFAEYKSSQLQAGARKATVEGLEPGNSYLFRIDAVGEDDATAVAFAQFRTPSAAKEAGRFTLVNVLMVLAVIAGGVAIWQRVRPQSGF